MSQGFTQPLPIPLPISRGGTGATSYTAPTTQVFTSGSGTYTTPANVKYIKVRGIGGGGGGAGGSGIIIVDEFYF